MHLDTSFEGARADVLRAESPGEVVIALRPETNAAFVRALMAASRDFQDTHGCPPERRDAAKLAMASNFVGQRFGCLALTIEMPLKDEVDHPERRKGWSPERSAQLGAAALDAVHTCLPHLR